MKSINGKIPVPPATIMILADSYKKSYLKPDPFGELNIIFPFH